METFKIIKAKDVHSLLNHDDLTRNKPIYKRESEGKTDV